MEKQHAFIETYENVQNSLGPDEAVRFVDAVHPTHAARPVGCWAPAKEHLVLAAVWIRHYSAAGRMGGDGHEVGVVFERLNQKSFGGVGAISFVSSGEN